MCCIGWLVVVPTAVLELWLAHGPPKTCAHLTPVSAGSLPTGEHSFPFQFLLPGESWSGWLVGTATLGQWAQKERCQVSVSALCSATAPTSFEGPFGRIVHQVKATIDTPRFSKDHKCSLVFYILSPLNLNNIPDIEVRMEQGSPW